jgi:hypothetical protein
MAGKDYAKIAASKIRTPSESNRRPRILVYGRNKKGKTRFCTTAPNVLIMDPEGGTDEEKKSNPDVWPIDSWDDINEVYQFLRGGGKSPRSGQPYQWVALDGLTKITNIALRWVMSQEEERNLERKPNQVGKQDYGKSGEMVKGMLHNFHSLRHLGVLITAQERMIEIEELGEEDEEAESVSAMFVPDLPKGARSSVNQVVDIIGRIYVVRGSFKKKYRDKATGKVITKEIDGLQRRLWIGPHASYDTGYRSDFILPDYIQDPSVPRVITAMREGKA